MEEPKEKGKEAEKNIFDKFVSKSVDFVFSNDNRKWVLLFVIIGFVLRTLVALRAEFYPDEMVHGPHAIGFIESGKLQIMDEDAVWFWLMNLTMKIFGVNAFGMRFLSIFLGSLTILVIYLLGKEVFNEKVGLFASFILAFSPFQLVETTGGMDISMVFFAMFAIYLQVMFFKTNKTKFFIFSWISLGVAIMTKQIAVLFIPAFVLFSLYHNKIYNRDYKIKQILIAALIIFLIVIPVLTFNYLLFKDKGIVDLQFARFTKIGFETYAGIAPTIQPFMLERLLISYKEGRAPGFLVGLTTFYDYESLIAIIFALAGVFFFYKSRNKFKLLLTLSFLFPYLFLAGTSLLSNHMTFGSSFIALLASLGIVNLSEKLEKKHIKKIFFCMVIVLIILFGIFKAYNTPYVNGFFGKNELAQVIDFKNSNIEPTSLVVVDSRIYTGRTVFMFWDRYYLDSNYFIEYIKNQDSFQGDAINVPVYFIEAVTDDSGWGTISSQPELNQTVESIVSLFKSMSPPLKTINDVRNNEPHFNIYKTILPVKSSIFNYAKSTHSWFYYPVEYKPIMQNFDYYETYNTFDTLLDKFAHLVLYLDVAASFVLLVYLLYLLYVK